MSRCASFWGGGVFQCCNLPPTNAPDATPTLVQVMDPSVKIAAVRVRMQPTPHCTVEIWSPDSQVEVSTPIHMQIGSPIFIDPLHAVWKRFPITVRHKQRGQLRPMEQTHSGMRANAMDSAVVSARAELRLQYGVQYWTCTEYHSRQAGRILNPDSHGDS